MERFLLETAVLALGVNEDDLMDCYIDSDENLECGRRIFVEKGSRVLMIQSQDDNPPDRGT